MSALAKKENHIFNCCGLGGASLFGDKSRNWGIKGHMIAFDLKKIIRDQKYFVLIQLTADKKYIFMCPRPQAGEMLLGASFE